jgi:hypothetical protein
VFIGETFGDETHFERLVDSGPPFVFSLSLGLLKLSLHAIKGRQGSNADPGWADYDDLRNEERGTCYQLNRGFPGLYRRG